MNTTTKPHTIPEQPREINAQLLEVRDVLIELRERRADDCRRCYTRCCHWQVDGICKHPAGHYDTCIYRKERQDS